MATKEEQRIYQRDWQRLRKSRINALKDVPCADCGGRFPPECMDFDHLRDKKFNVNQAWNRRIEVILAEAAKCEIVCANCHRIRTKQRIYASLA